MNTVDQIRYDREQLDEALRSGVGISVELYKVVKNLTQLSGAGAGIYAMSLGADPMTTFVLIGFIISGPEFIEYAITNGD